MVRKRRTRPSGASDGSESQEPSGSAGQGGPQHPVEGALPQQQGGGRGRGRSLADPPQSQQGGRGSGFYRSQSGGPQYQGATPHQPQTRAPQQHSGGCGGSSSMTSGHGVPLLLVHQGQQYLSGTKQPRLHIMQLRHPC